MLTTHEAIEPIRFEGKPSGVLTTTASRWIRRAGIPASSAGPVSTGPPSPPDIMLEEASPVATAIARRYLQAAGDEPALDLAAATDPDLLRRLGVATGDGRLTNAAGAPVRRDPRGRHRLHTPRLPGRRQHKSRQKPTALDRAGMGRGPGEPGIESPGPRSRGVRPRGQLRAIPSRAVREVIVNGVIHRDWLSPQSTVVEHTGDMLAVTSPGGFLGGITPANIITHPAVPRYRSLAEAMATLRLGEREGIGVDRIVRDMLAIGRPEPEISGLALRSSQPGRR